jgi:hypothetical protein
MSYDLVFEPAISDKLTIIYNILGVFAAKIILSFFVNFVGILFYTDRPFKVRICTRVNNTRTPLAHSISNVSTIVSVVSLIFTT